MGNKTTFIATGDSYMTRRLGEEGYEGFDALSGIIKDHQVRFNNLEITVHNQEGYPNAVSGGTWGMAEPEILDDLKRFGFNLFNTANNHSMDYSHGGLLATIRHLRERDMIFCGTGKDLAEAAAPAYVETKHARVAMVAASASYKESAPAGQMGPDLCGRPGLNPLGHKKIVSVTPGDFAVLKKIVDETEVNAAQVRSVLLGYKNPPPDGELTLGDITFRRGERNELHTQPVKRDMDRILASIREARRQADYVLVSIHAHASLHIDMGEPAEFLQTFCRACIDEGADAVIGHGPHEVRGIEIYKGKAIFYSLGNFIFQTETVRTLPSDARVGANLPAEATVGEIMDKRSRNGTRGFVTQSRVWNSVMASFAAEDGKLTEIKLYPISLGQSEPRSRRGNPVLTGDEEILRYVARLSEPFGTKIDIAGGVATVRLE